MSLKVVFAPLVSNVFEDEFEISFTDEYVDPIIVKVKAVSIDLPVWVEREVCL